MNYLHSYKIRGILIKLATPATVILIQLIGLRPDRNAQK